MRFAKEKKRGIHGGHLAACPASPNCVVSENADSKHAIEPLSFNSEATLAWEHAKQAIKRIGGEIKALDDSYLWATFTSKIMRYVDDVELRLDGPMQTIHMRSVSRVGYGDLGANRRRMERLRTVFAELQS